MLKQPLPTPTRRRSALVLTCALIAAANYAVWTTLPRGAAAQAISTAAKTLNEAIGLLNAEKFAEAKLAIGTLDLSTLTPYERSHAEMVLFGLALRDRRLDEARSHLQKAVDAGGLTPEQAARVRDQGTQALQAAASEVFVIR